MKVVLQRVKSAKVVIKDETVGEIDDGLLLLVGVGHADTEKQADWMAEKIVKMRIFAEPTSEVPTKVGKEKIGRSIKDVNGSILAISQFTLYGDCKKGNRPSFIKAARPEHAEPLFNYFVKSLKDRGFEVETGRFGQYMEVSLVNDGPTTILLDTEAK